MKHSVGSMLYLKFCFYFSLLYCSWHADILQEMDADQTNISMQPHDELMERLDEMEEKMRKMESWMKGKIDAEDMMIMKMREKMAEEELTMLRIEAKEQAKERKEQMVRDEQLAMREREASDFPDQEGRLIEQTLIDLAKLGGKGFLVHWKR